MTDAQVLLAQEAREEKILLADIDQRLDVLLSAKDVGPDARAHLRSLLAYYAKKPKPFTACVRDNMKRFGPGKTERVCATLKDMIRGTTRWRGHPELDSGSVVSASDAPEIPESVVELALSFEDGELERILLEVAR